MVYKGDYKSVKLGCISAATLQCATLYPSFSFDLRFPRPILVHDMAPNPNTHHTQPLGTCSGNTAAAHATHAGAQRRHRAERTAGGRGRRRWWRCGDGDRTHTPHQPNAVGVAVFFFVFLLLQKKKACGLPPTGPHCVSRKWPSYRLLAGRRARDDQFFKKQTFGDGF